MLCVCMLQVKGCSPGFLQKGASSRRAANVWCHNQFTQSRQGTKEEGGTVNICGIWKYWGGLVHDKTIRILVSKWGVSPNSLTSRRGKILQCRQTASASRTWVTVVKLVKQLPESKIQLVLVFTENIYAQTRKITVQNRLKFTSNM